MAITEKQTKTVVVADAKSVGAKIKVTIGRDLTVDESKRLRKLLKQAESNASCSRPHNALADMLAGIRV